MRFFSICCFLILLATLVTTSEAQTKLWGLTSTGGSHGGGTIGYFDPASDTWVTEYSFVAETGKTPRGSLTLYNGKLYGMTSKGGSHDAGVIFEYDPETHLYASKIDFTGPNGSSPYGSLTLFNDKFYGMTFSGGLSYYGVIFEWDPHTNVMVTKIFFEPTNSLNGGNPAGSLLLDRGIFYGITSWGVGYDQGLWHGVAFRWNPVSGENMKVALPIDAAMSMGSLIKFGSDFYGLSENGFAANGSNGSIWKWDGTSNAMTVVTGLPFEHPTGSLTVVGDKMFGLGAGYSSIKGNVFQWDPVENKFIQSVFFNGEDGSYPRGTLTYSQGKLYGLTYAGGANDLGTIFEFDIAAGKIMKKVDFSNSTGGNPYYTQLLEVSSSPLEQSIYFATLVDKTYGDESFALSATATSGLPVSYQSSDPTIVTVTDNTATILKAGTVTITASQSGNSTYAPAVDVQKTFTIKKAIPQIIWENPQDIIGGTPLTSTQLNATASAPGVISYSPVAGTILAEGNSQILSLTFTPADGENYTSVNKQVSINVVDFVIPAGPLFWSLTNAGGLSNGGVLFNSLPNGTQARVLFNFGSVSGSTPVGRLLLKNAKYYGLTKYGGVNDAGTIFEYDPSSGQFITVAHMANVNGQAPNGSLIATTDGKIYGTCQYGGQYGFGVLFEYDYEAKVIVKRFDFNFSVPESFYPEGAVFPKGILLEGVNGKLYGVAGGGIFDGQGTIYEFDPSNGNYKTLAAFGTKDPSTSEGNPGPGKYPDGSIIFGADGFIYGSTPTGGYGAKPQNLESQRGTLFKLSTDGTLTHFFSFSGSILSGTPSGGVTEYNGKLYGTTTGGGLAGSGELFEFDLSTGAMSKRADFISASTGGNPSGSLTVVNGKFYGMTSNGGAHDKGTIFEFDPASGLLKKTFDFDGVNGLPGDNNILVYHKASQSIVFESLASRKVSDEPFLLESTSSSGLSVTYTSSQPSVASVDADKITILKAGTTVITAKQGGNENYYAANDVSQLLTISKLDPVIVWSDPSDIVYDTPLSHVQLNATSDTEGTFVYVPDDGTKLNAGEDQLLSVTFTPADEGHFEVVRKDVHIDVTKATQEITFPSISDQTVEGGRVALLASASSGLPVTYLTSDHVALDENQLVLITPGRALVTATQDGNSNFLPAPAVDRSFCIQPPVPVITLDNQLLSLTSSSLVGNQWYLNGQPIVGANEQTLAIVKSGIYTVQATADNCSSEFSTGHVLVITDESEALNQKIIVTPNPATDRIYVNSGDKRILDIEVFGITGVIIPQRQEAESGVIVNISDYAPGTYLLKVTTESDVRIIRFVKL